MELIGERVGHVRIEALLGRGGMGEVYRGFDEKLQRPVAVKTLRAERLLTPAARARILREARILSRLDHPSICRVYDMVESRNTDFLILELIDGRPLSEVVREVDAVPVDQKLRILEEVARALAAAHREAIVHRDLKPDNVMLTATGGVKVLDFGIARSLAGMPAGGEDAAAAAPDGAPGDIEPAPEARAASSPEGRQEPQVPTLRMTPAWSGSTPTALTMPGSVVGTLLYMSPEQASGDEITEASDMYSFGVLAQELLTGKAAYEASPDGELLEKVRRADTLPVQGLDADLASLIGGLIRRDPRERPSAEETARRLAWIASKPERRRRRRRLTGLAAAILALLVASGVVGHRVASRPLLRPDQEGQVLLLPFVNATGDAAQDWVEHGLMEMVSHTLDATEGVTVVPPSEVIRGLDNRGIASVQGLDSETILQLLRAFGADIGIAARLRREDDTYLLEYTSYSIEGSAGSRRVEAADPTAAANLLSTRLSRRLRPRAATVDLRDRFSEDPLVNQLYAMGVSALQRAGPAVAVAYFQVCLHRDPQLLWAELKLAIAHERLGDWDRSSELGRGVLRKAEAGGLTEVMEETFLHLALLDRNRGEFAAARESYQRVLVSARRRGDDRRVGHSVRGLGAVDLFEGDLEEAEERFRQAAEIHRRLGDRVGEMHALANLSAVFDARGEMTRAEELDTRVLEMARALGDLQAQADYLNNLGVTARGMNDLERAEELYLESLALQRRLGNRPREANTLHNLGEIARLRFQLGRAEQLHRDAFAIFSELDDHTGKGRASLALAELLLFDRRLREAEELIAAAEGWRPEDSQVIELRALLAYQRGAFAEALSRQESAKEAAEDAWAAAQEERLDLYGRARDSGVRQPLPEEISQHPSQLID